MEETAKSRGGLSKRTQILLAFVSPLVIAVGTLAGYVYGQGKQAQRIDYIFEKLDEHNKKFEKVDAVINTINTRLAVIETTTGSMDSKIEKWLNPASPFNSFKLMNQPKPQFDR